MEPKCRVQVRCKADRETVYSILSDVQSHLVWNGEQQAKDFRLHTLDGPQGRQAPARPSLRQATFPCRGGFGVMSRS